MYRRIHCSENLSGADALKYDVYEAFEMIFRGLIFVFAALFVRFAACGNKKDVDKDRKYFVIYYICKIWNSFDCGNR